MSLNIKRASFFECLVNWFQVYATPNQKERVRYALEIGANITDFFEDYFEVRSCSQMFFCYFIHVF